MPFLLCFLNYSWINDPLRLRKSGKSQEKITFFYSNQRALEQHPWWKLWAT